MVPQIPYGVLPVVAWTIATIVRVGPPVTPFMGSVEVEDRKSTRLNSSH